MNLRFAVAHAARERRATMRRLGVYMLAITLGVTALVAVNSTRANIIGSVHQQARAVLGADVRLGSGRPFPDAVQAVLDSAAAAGTRVGTMTSLMSMALAPDGATRMVQVRALAGGFPFYGRVTVEPAGVWPVRGDALLADPVLLAQLDVAVGDTLIIAGTPFVIRGTVRGVPGEAAFQNVIGPRVFIDGARLDPAVTGHGSLARYNAYLELPDAAAAQRFIDRHHDLFRRNSIGMRTAADQAENIAEAFDALGRFLGLIGLAALLLGGVGIASAVNVFIREKRATIAVLRCMGATQATAFTAYLLQAALLGLAGAALGALLGIGLAALLPAVLGDVLPVDVAVRVAWGSVASGIAIGAGVATLFALLPLLEIRGIAPLRALRQPVEEPPRRFDILRAGAIVLLAAVVAALAVWQAGDTRAGLAFAAGLVATLLLLRAAAWALTRLTRRFLPRRASFAVRQGVAALFRPYNQTAAVTMALGFGVFLIASIWLVQRNLLDWLAFDATGAQPNLVVIDIQTDQRDDVAAILRAAGVAAPEMVPIVPARIARINGRTVDELLSGPDARRLEPWAVRREYRHTYRAELSGGETLVAGEWWNGPAGADRRADAASDAAPGRISIERDLARGLDVGIGDRITWSFLGVEIETTIASIRSVDWARFETNFFVVFEPGVIDAAPQTLVSLAHIADDEQRVAIQRELTVRHPNLTTIDLEEVQRSLAEILGQVVLALRFMAGFSIVAGILVLAGAIAATRFQRVRESVLLRTIGATRAQVRTILLAEYIALGTLAAVIGIGLAAVAAWILVVRFFQIPFQPHALDMVVMAGIVAAATAVLGMANSGEALRGTPLATLREAD